ncbi:hypothetical protein O181_091299 [Austropuccinia psidii MF-1]|uniref:Uncharacterized protein n=1 Tax=Austropuccinia psidii MF-1 TaxID=1389203 RepID=A0A9Q3P7S8_9BASI|nr:hypothetical protein [Austropuccinia psidii MF-1]
MGDPFFNLFTVSSSVPGESTPLEAASPASPVFSASTAPLRHLYLIQALLFPLLRLHLQYPLNPHIQMGRLMELTFVHDCPPHSHKFTLESIWAGVIHLVHLYRQLKE